MNKAEVQSGILRSWNAVDKLKLGMTLSQTMPLEVDGDFRDIALSPESSYPALYLCGARKSNYNFMLSDYSYFQFSCSGEYEVAYAYYPNPFGNGMRDISRWRELFESEMVTEAEFEAFMSNLPIFIKQPVIRYENSRKQYDELKHPCSHLHIGYHRDNRWAVGRVLTPAAFTLFVLKQYYPEQWANIGDHEYDGFLNAFESDLVKERTDSRIIGDDFFTEREKRTFHIW